MLSRSPSSRRRRHGNDDDDDLGSVVAARYHPDDDDDDDDDGNGNGMPTPHEYPPFQTKGGTVTRSGAKIPSHLLDLSLDDDHHHRNDILVAAETSRTHDNILTTAVPPQYHRLKHSDTAIKSTHVPRAVVERLHDAQQSQLQPESALANPREMSTRIVLDSMNRHDNRRRHGQHQDQQVMPAFPFVRQPSSSPSTSIRADASLANTGSRGTSTRQTGAGRSRSVHSGSGVVSEHISNGSSRATSQRVASTQDPSNDTRSHASTGTRRSAADVRRTAHQQSTERDGASTRGSNKNLERESKHRAGQSRHRSSLDVRAAQLAQGALDLSPTERVFHDLEKIQSPTHSPKRAVYNVPEAYRNTQSRILTEPTLSYKPIESIPRVKRSFMLIPTIPLVHSTAKPPEREQERISFALHHNL